MREVKIVVQQDRVRDGGVTGCVEGIAQVMQVDETKRNFGMRDICGVFRRLRLVVGVVEGSLC